MINEGGKGGLVAEMDKLFPVPGMFALEHLQRNLITRLRKCPEDLSRTTLSENLTEDVASATSADGALPAAGRAANTMEKWHVSHLQEDPAGGAWLGSFTARH
jgi:hypothetical protein